VAGISFSLEIFFGLVNGRFPGARGMDGPLIALRRGENCPKFAALAMSGLRLI
jgi:hypothetical protein